MSNRPAVEFKNVKAGWMVIVPLVTVAGAVVVRTLLGWLEIIDDALDDATAAVAFFMGALLKVPLPCLDNSCPWLLEVGGGESNDDTEDVVDEDRPYVGIVERVAPALERTLELLMVTLGR
jgi:hypothetical protein